MLVGDVLTVCKLCSFTYNHPHHKVLQYKCGLVIILQHEGVLLWPTALRVCAGYGLLQHMRVLTWSIIAHGCAGYASLQ